MGKGLQSDQENQVCWRRLTNSEDNRIKTQSGLPKFGMRVVKSTGTMKLSGNNVNWIRRNWVKEPISGDFQVLDIQNIVFMTSDSLYMGWIVVSHNISLSDYLYSHASTI